MVARDERIAYRWVMGGTHPGEYEGLAPTGKAIRFTGMTFLRLHDGKIVEDHFESAGPDEDQLRAP